MTVFRWGCADDEVGKVESDRIGVGEEREVEEEEESCQMTESSLTGLDIDRKRCFFTSEGC